MIKLLNCYHKYICVLFLLIFGIGCNSNASVKPVDSNPKEINKNKSDSQVIVKEIVTNDSDQKQTPEQSVFNQVKWKFSNDKVIAASKESLLQSSVLGKNGFVFLRLPETTKPWYNVIYLRNKDDYWNISGAIDMPIVETHTEKSGIEIPMENFSVAKLKTLNSPKDNVWAFANETKYLTISKYAREPFTLPAGFEEISINEHAAWVKTENDSTSSLFYYDSDQLIWIVGKLSKSEVENLAKSLPSANSPFFPSKEKG